MRKLAIIHFSPLELYPPVQNLLRSLESNGEETFYVYTTRKSLKQLSTFTTSNSNIRIKRFGRSGNDLSPLSRWFGYCNFYTSTLVHMIITRPIKILYYETISFLPVYLYRKYIGKRVNVWAHYHEYTSPAEYEAGMRLTRIFHKLERQVYGDMDGISHTNESRLQMFMEDIAPTKLKSKFAIPNFPPKTWHPVSTKRSDKIKIVYIGALSIDTMYTKEFAFWVEEQKGKVQWDIYSFNITPDAQSILSERQHDHIKVFDGVDYDDLPQILSHYDVGVILYRGHTTNHIYSAPNKLFEYLRFGLQVWLPDCLISSMPYLEDVNHPKVLALNFNSFDLRSDEIDIEKIFPEDKFIAEEANKPLIAYLKHDRLLKSENTKSILGLC